jgi:nitrate reductase NapE component
MGTTTTYAPPPVWFGEALGDAERLLKYSSEIGVDVDPDIRDHILEARSAASAWDEKTAATLLSALAKLAARLKPVTALSLEARVEDVRAAVRTYWIVAVCLALIIFPISVASFVGTAISNSMRTEIATANDLAVKLRTQLGAPEGSGAVSAASGAPAGTSAMDSANEVTELQQFAISVRAIDARARQLNVLAFHAEHDPFAPIRRDQKKLHDTFQLPAGLPNLSRAAGDLTAVYQDVRYFGQSLLEDISFYYGAITVCLLPALYALLGTCAYLLRTFELQTASRTFIPSGADSARFLIAAIGGAVVGLFNNFTIGQGASIPPLAIAFLVGYAVDVFFAFLEGLLSTFAKKAPQTVSGQ